MDELSLSQVELQREWDQRKHLLCLPPSQIATTMSTTIDALDIPETPQNYIPALVQGRLGGHKGVWFTHPRLPGRLLTTRPSQEKIDSTDRKSVV